MNLNPINYARGLMADIETSALHGLKDRTAYSLSELETTVAHLRTYDVSHLAGEVEAMRVKVLADAEAVLAATPKRAARKTV